MFYLTEDVATNTWYNNELHTCGPNKCKHPLQSIYEPKILAFGEDEEGMKVYIHFTDEGLLPETNILSSLSELIIVRTHLETSFFLF